MNRGEILDANFSGHIFWRPRVLSKQVFMLPFYEHQFYEHKFIIKNRFPTRTHMRIDSAIDTGEYKYITLTVTTCKSPFNRRPGNNDGRLLRARSDEGAPAWKSRSNSFRMHPAVDSNHFCTLYSEKNTKLLEKKFWINLHVLTIVWYNKEVTGNISDLNI